MTLPDLKLYHKPIIVKIVGYWNKNRHINQCYRIEKSRNKPILIRSINI